MINELLSRPNIQEFLNKYPSNCWKELLADLFEIGVLNLRNSYHRDEFSKKEFRALIYDLQHPSYEPENRPSNYYNNYQSNQRNLNYNRYPNYTPNYYQTPSENLSNYSFNNYDFERRRNRLNKLKQHASTSQMDAFYSEKNVVYPNKIPLKVPRRSHQQIVDNINKSRTIRDAQRDQIKDLKIQYLQDHKEELKHKRMERMIEQQAEEDIKNQEEEKRRIKQEQDFQEGYGEEYQEEDEIEEEEETDKYNDYNRGYDDEEGEEGYEEQNYEEQEYQGNPGYNQNIQNIPNEPIPGY